MKFPQPDGFSKFATFCGFAVLAIIFLKINIYVYHIVYLGKMQGQWGGITLTYPDMQGYWQWHVGRILIVVEIVLVALAIFFFLLTRYSKP